jgi:outer membrane protein assembly factor BamA
MVQLRIDFDSYHPVFNQATQAALAAAPDVPGVYRQRQNFAPSLSVIPLRDLKLSIGTSFERFQIQYPQTHTQTAYAGTADIQFRHIVRTQSHYRHDVRATYSLRTATRILDSDYVYARHFATVDYTVSKGRSLFGAHLQGGLITGTAPLFERFSLGNSLTLRGWNKFDLAPLGGTRSAHGSLEYRYRPFQFFYDVGTVYDLGQPARVRHGLGIGYVSRDGFFASLAFPVRLHNVVPMFILGFRF